VTATRALDAIIGPLSGGAKPTSAQLAALSSLEPADADSLRRSWLEIPADTRELVLARATELAEDNVDLDYGALAMIAMDDPEPAVRRRAV
jgi:hypothetical protein